MTRSARLAFVLLLTFGPLTADGQWVAPSRFENARAALPQLEFHGRDLDAPTACQEAFTKALVVGAIVGAVVVVVGTLIQIGRYTLEGGGRPRSRNGVVAAGVITGAIIVGGVWWTECRQ